MTNLYSKERVFAVVVLLFVYFAIYSILFWSTKHGVLRLSQNITNIETLAVSMPFVSLYILVLIGFSAGYARTAAAAKALGLTQAVREQLRARSMENATIKSKVRANSKVTMDTRFLRTLEKVVTARLPILPVEEDPKDPKVKYVITMHDILKMITHRINTAQENSQEAQLYAELAKLEVKDLNPRKVVTCKENENLESVLNTMIQGRVTKLVVMGKDGASYVGTIDLFDIVSEMLSEQT